MSLSPSLFRSPPLPPPVSHYHCAYRPRRVGVPSSRRPRRCHTSGAAHFRYSYLYKCIPYLLPSRPAVSKSWKVRGTTGLVLRSLPFWSWGPCCDVVGSLFLRNPGVCVLRPCLGVSGVQCVVQVETPSLRRQSSPTGSRDSCPVGGSQETREPFGSPG